MSSLNRIQIIGHLGRDVELKYTASGKVVANFSVATSIKDSNGKEITEWHRITIWDKAAENCARFLSKGKMCYVDGRLQTRSWEKDGNKFSAVEIIANQVLFLSSNSTAQQPEHVNTLSSKSGSSFPSDLDDIPF